MDKRTRGFICCNGHFTCRQCFALYVTSTCENAGKLSDYGFVMRCPDPTCKSEPWTTEQLRKNLKGETLEVYIDTLIRFSRKIAAGEAVSDIVKDSLLKQVTSALDIRCPKCKTVLDQNADGCAAMRCESCATHFCWLCFKI